jgi:RNA polymerase sigma-B factor
VKLPARADSSLVVLCRILVKIRGSTELKDSVFGKIRGLTLFCIGQFEENVEVEKNSIHNRKQPMATLTSKSAPANKELSAEDKASQRTAESMSMLIAYHQQPNVRTRNKLVMMNAGLVRQVAHRISRQCIETYQDLEQIGYLGLIRAIERFNPHQGCAFSSFAVPYIRGEILHFLRDRSSVVKIPRRWQELQKEGEKMRQHLTTILNRKPTEIEIADALQISLQEWRETQAAEHNRQTLSLDATVGQMLDCPVTLGDSLPDTREQNRQFVEEERQQLAGMIDQLETKTQQAIEYVYIKGMPRKEAAKKIGVSPMTVTRHLQRGVKQLSAMLENDNEMVG